MQFVKFEGQGESRSNTCTGRNNIVSQVGSEGQERIRYHMFADPRLEHHRFQEVPPRTGEELFDYLKRWANQIPAMSKERSERRADAEVFPKQPMSGDLCEKDHVVKTGGMIASETLEEQRRAEGVSEATKGKSAVREISGELKESLSRGGRNQSERTGCIPPTPPPPPPGFGVGIQLDRKCKGIHEEIESTYWGKSTMRKYFPPPNVYIEVDIGDFLNFLQERQVSKETHETLLDLFDSPEEVRRIFQVGAEDVCIEECIAYFVR